MSGQQRNLIIFFMGAALIVAASLMSPNFKRAVAEVDGEKISESTLKRALDVRIAAHKARGLAVNEKLLKRAVLNELIADVLVLHGAKSKGITVGDKEVNETVEAIRKGMPPGELERQLKKNNIPYSDFLINLRDNMIIDRFEKTLVGSDAVTEEEMKSFYGSGFAPVTKPERTKLRLIEVKTEEAAKDIIKEMKDKALTFDKMAEKLRKNNSEAIVSFSGWVQLDVFSPQMASEIKNIQKGHYGGPIQGKDGWYLIKVEDTEAPKTATYEESKERIRHIILEQKQRDALIGWVEARKQSARIEINEKALL